MLPFLELLDTQEEKEQLLLIYECFKAPLYEIAYCKVKQIELAEDMVHDTFMALTKHLNKVEIETYDFFRRYLKEKEENVDLTMTEYSIVTEDKTHIRAWNYVVTILYHKIYDYWDKKESKSLIYVEEYDDSTAFTDIEPLSVIQEKEIKILLKEAILSMRSPYKDVICMKYYQKMSVKEIAEVLDKSNDSVKKMLERGRKMLRQKLEEGGCCDA